MWATTQPLWELNLPLMVCQFSFLAHLFWILVGRTSYSTFGAHFLCKLHRSLHLLHQKHLCQTRTGQDLSPNQQCGTQIMCSYPWTIRFHISIHCFCLACVSLPHFSTNRWQFACELVGFSIRRCFVTAWDTRLAPFTSQNTHLSPCPALKT